MSQPDTKLPITAPKPLVIIINKFCADERIFWLNRSLNKQRAGNVEKSKAIPYTYNAGQQNIIHKPEEGLPIPNKPNEAPRQQSLKNITF